MRKLILTGAAAVVVAASATTAAAACRVDTESVTFGTVAIGSATDTTGRIRVTCDEPTDFDVAILAEGGSSRSMVSGDGHRLTYQLYINATRTLPWGDGSGIGPTATGSNNGEEPTDLIVYGRIPVQDTPIPGNYSDQLTVVLNF